MSWNGVDLQPAPQSLGPLAHALQTEMQPVRHSPRIPSRAVVFDGHPDPRAVPLETNPRVIGAGVLPHVGKCFLNDADQLDLGSGRKSRKRSFGDVEFDVNSVLCAEFVQKLGEGGNQPEPARDERAEADIDWRTSSYTWSVRITISRIASAMPGMSPDRSSALHSFRWSRPSP